ncbi:Gfo/Idh/MocA family oxidoreductase [Amycolatopsis sp. NPDC026612]|uniref:Gfo/Idh/MocA family protein n=1 Tax=Amycolatopsis sp. NPDC026612 TaxID=3155466 RepID=UPI0033E40210
MVQVVRQRAFSEHHGVAAYRTLAELLADRRVEVVVKLTNPGSHFEVNRAAFTAGKHVFVEKPLALGLAEAQELVELAAARRLALGSAPSSLLGEAAQTAWRAVREGAIGVPRLAYAELDDGPIQRMPFHTWVSTSGPPGPTSTSSARDAPSSTRGTPSPG